MPSLPQSTNPWPPHDRNSTSAADWADAFCAAFPDSGVKAAGAAMWFLHALEAGYRAGRAHADFPSV